MKGTELTFKPTIYVTARPIRNEVSENWLNLYNFPKAPVVTVGFDKGKVEALRGKVDVFLDDSIRNFEELNGAGINCLLVTRSHNANYNANGKRVKDLLTFQKELI